MRTDGAMGTTGRGEWNHLNTIAGLQLICHLTLTIRIEVEYYIEDGDLTIVRTSDERLPIRCNGVPAYCCVFVPTFVLAMIFIHSLS